MSRAAPKFRLLTQISRVALKFPRVSHPNFYLPNWWGEVRNLCQRAITVGSSVFCNFHETEGQKKRKKRETEGHLEFLEQHAEFLVQYAEFLVQYATFLVQYAAIFGATREDLFLGVAVCDVSLVLPRPTLTQVCGLLIKVCCYQCRVAMATDLAVSDIDKSYLYAGASCKTVGHWIAGVTDTI